VCWSSMVYRIVDVVCNDLHFAAEFGVPEQKAGNSAEGRQLSRRQATQQKARAAQQKARAASRKLTRCFRPAYSWLWCKKKQ
jgi:hypothetical protein